MFGKENAAFINDFVSLVEQLYNSQYYTCFMNGGANSPKWNEYNDRIDNATSIEDKADIIRVREYVEHNEYSKLMFSAQFASDFPLFAMGTIGTTMQYNKINKPIRVPISSRLSIGHSKQWNKMIIKEREAFQHSYTKHREELGLPNWQQTNAENLRILFNNKIRFIRNRGVNSFFKSREWHNGRMIEVNRTHVKLGGKIYYYYETRSGKFISAGILNKK